MVATHKTKAQPSFDNFHHAFSGPPSDPYGCAVALLSIRFSFAGFENAHCKTFDIRRWPGVDFDSE